MLLKKAVGFWVGILALAALMAYLLVTLGTFPYIGLALTLVVMIVLVLGVKPIRTGMEIGYALMGIILAVFIALRTNFVLIFVNFLGVLGLGSLLVMNYSKTVTIKELLVVIVNALAKIFQSRPMIDRWAWLTTGKTKNSKNQEALIMGIGACLLVLVLILPALAGANPIFNRWLEQLLPSLNEETFIWVVRGLACGFLVWFLPKLMRAGQIASHPEGNKREWHVWWGLPKIAAASIVLLFLASQVSLYLMNGEQLALAGISHSERTRDVFGQLLWMTAVMAGLVMVELKPKKLTGLNWWLLSEGLVLVMLAGYSDVSYIQAWGFTFKRLYGLVLIVWILGLMGGLVLAYKWRFWRDRLGLWLVYLTGIIWVSVNLANFDYLIYHFNRARTGRGEDVEYLSRLNPESMSYQEQLLDLSAKAGQNQDYVSQEQMYAFGQVFYKTKWLKEKYSKLQLGGFNLSEYLTFRQTAGMDLNALEVQINRLIVTQP